MAKYRVTMKNVIALGNGEIATQVITDYVPEEILESYVADARTRHQGVEVSEEPDWGPGGEDGETVIPDELS